MYPIFSKLCVTDLPTDQSSYEPSMGVINLEKSHMGLMWSVSSICLVSLNRPMLWVFFFSYFPLSLSAESSKYPTRYKLFLLTPPKFPENCSTGMFGLILIDMIVRYIHGSQSESKSWNKHMENELNWKRTTPPSLKFIHIRQKQPSLFPITWEGMS